MWTIKEMSKRKYEAIISKKQYLNASFIFCCSQYSSNSLPDTPHLARPPGPHLSTVSYINIDAHLTSIFCVEKESCGTRPDYDAPDCRNIGWIPLTKLCSQEGCVWRPDKARGLGLQRPGQAWLPVWPAAARPDCELCSHGQQFYTSWRPWNTELWGLTAVPGLSWLGGNKSADLFPPGPFYRALMY